MKIRTKETAEAVLRELPSVLGAFVKEDVDGRPREVHVLVRPGPNARYLSRDIRELLEERLGIAVDQRVISIAQIEQPTEESGSDRADADEPRTPDGDRDRRHRTAETGTTEHMRLVYAGLESERRENRIAVRVRLTRGAEEFVGDADALDTELGRLRAAAAATVQALTRGCRERIRFELESAAAIDAFGREYVHVAVIAISPALLGRRPLTLAGAHPLVEESEEVAAVLATLKATNRIAERALRAAEDADDDAAGPAPQPGAGGASSERSEM